MDCQTEKLVQRIVADIRFIADQEPEYLEVGKVWYWEAHALAQALALRSGHTLEQAAAVLAHLSPGVRWGHCIEDAEKLLRYHREGRPRPSLRTYHSCVHRAWAAAGAFEPEKTFGPGALKTYRFYRNIVDPEGPEVTLDRHMLRYLGLPRLTTKSYLDHEAAFQEAARILELIPNQVQATLWVKVRAEA